MMRRDQRPKPGSARLAWKSVWRAVPGAMPPVGFVAAMSILVMSWAMGGAVAWGSWFIGGVGWLSWSVYMAATVIRREWHRLVLWVNIPWLGLAVYLAISIANPAFVVGPGGASARSVDFIHWLPSTVNVDRSIRYAFALTGAVMMSIPLFQARWKRSQIRNFVGVLAVNAALLAAVGAVYHLAGGRKLLGLVDPEGGGAFATFHHKNVWAAFAVLGVSQAAALVGYRVSRRGHLLSGNGALWVWAALVPIVALSLALNNSRAGLVALTLCFVWVSRLWIVRVLVRRRSDTRENDALRRWLTRALVAGCVVISGYFLVQITAGEFRDISNRTAGQWDEGVYFGGRLARDRDTITMGLEKPWLGWGLGSFLQVFPNFQQEDQFRRVNLPGGDFVWVPSPKEYANCEYLQYWVELGAIGLMLLLIPGIGFVIHVFRHGRASPVSRWLGLGCAMVMVIALVDFPFASEAVMIAFIAHAAIDGKYALLYATRSRRSRKAAT